LGKTISEKILAKAAGRKEVLPGEIVEARIDLAMLHENTGTPAVMAFREIGLESVGRRSQGRMPRHRSSERRVANKPKDGVYPSYNQLGLDSIVFYKRSILGTRTKTGSPGEFHPQAPTDPYVNLSIHTALLTQSISTIDFALVKDSSHCWLT